MAARDRFELCSRNHDCPATWNSYSVSPLSVWESVAQSTRMSGWISPVLSSRLVTDVARLHYEFFKVTNYVSTPIACRADRQWWPSNVDVSARRYKFTRAWFAHHLYLYYLRRNWPKKVKPLRFGYFTFFLFFNRFGWFRGSEISINTKEKY